MPSTDLKHVCHRAFEDFREYLNESKRIKSFDNIPDDVLREAVWIGADMPTMGGHTGFAMMFSRKSTSDPFSRLESRAVYHRGELFSLPASAVGVTNPNPFKPQPESGLGHDLAQLADHEALWMLYQASCSVPKGYMCSITKKAELAARTQQSRTASRHHAGSKNDGVRRAPTMRGGGEAGPPSILPGWMSLVLDGSRRLIEREESAQSYLKQLKRLIGEEESTGGDWVAVHVGNEVMPCPMMLSQDPPVKYSHKSNGVILAVLTGDPSVVYARCTACIRSPTTNPHIARVFKASSGCGDADQSPWVKFTEKGLEDLLFVQDVEEGNLPRPLLFSA